jgi:aspartate-semialdehyde dehydrogenase
VRVGIVGVGPVGDRIVRVLRERGVPVARDPLVMATSARPEVLDGRTFGVEETSERLLKDLDLCFFAGREGARGASKTWRPVVERHQVPSIDNGSDFRMDDDTPLIVPEVNMDDVALNPRFIASPNCSTIQMVVALAPLHRAATIKRIVVTTYQAVSGWGGKAMDELREQSVRYLAGEAVTFDPSVFAHPIAFDCLPHIDRFDQSGYTREELKMVGETRKILGAPALAISATTVRVPVFIGHGEAINVEFERQMSADKALAILRDPKAAPGVYVIDAPTDDPNALAIREDRLERAYPVSRDLERPELADLVLVGRVRDDPTLPNTINLWVVADNLRKGAATNVVQIAEEMIERGLLPNR